MYVRKSVKHDIFIYNATLWLKMTKMSHFCMDPSGLIFLDLPVLDQRFILLSTPSNHVLVILFFSNETFLVVF